MAPLGVAADYQVRRGNLNDHFVSVRFLQNEFKVENIPRVLKHWSRLRHRQYIRSKSEQQSPGCRGDIQLSISLTGEVVVQEELLQLSEVPQLLSYQPWPDQHSAVTESEK